MISLHHLRQCAQNGITESTFVKKPESITSIELCFHTVTKMYGFYHFQNLRSLCIVAQDVAEIEGLENSPSLEELWICETKVATIKGLDNCVRLKKLFLYSNRISAIGGFDKLVNLESLWLSDNQISVLENLSRLKKLRQLQIGNNRIASVGDALNENVELKELNIAGNKLSSFREVLFLARLPRLTSLCLSDPNFADNPICSLCNYQTHVIYHLPNLLSLDTLEVTDESRRIINATVLKKRMYYNMRIRTIKRNTNFLARLLDTRNADELASLIEDLKGLVYRLKRIQKRQDDIALQARHADKIQVPHMNSELEEGRGILLELIAKKSRTLSSLRTHKMEISAHILQQSDMAVRKLLLELETGGNVRFEDEQREEPWFAACDALVRRFIARGSTCQPQRKVTIHRISRLHNRFLRNKFEAKSSSKSCDPDRGPFDYLCFQGTDAHPEHVFAAAEHGFVTDTDEGFDGSEPTNSQVILANFLDCRDPKSGVEGQTTRKRLRQAIIVKVYASQLEQIRDEDASPSKQSRSRSIQPSERPQSSSVQTDSLGYFTTIDRNRILPEYFIEYSLQSDLDRLTTRAERLMVDIACSNKLGQADMPAVVTEAAGTLGDGAELNAKINNVSMASIESQYPIVNIAAAEYQFPPQDAAILMSKPSPPIEHLNLTHHPFRSLEEFTALTSLRSISVSHCGIDHVPTLRHFPKLERLDISFNRIEVLDKVISAPDLMWLDASGNRIVDLEIFENATSLVGLDLRFNPVCERKGYKKLAIRHIRRLKNLDGLDVDLSEKECDEPTGPELIVSRSSSQPHLFRPLSVRTFSGYGSSAAQNEYWRVSHHPHLKAGMIAESLTTLELDSCSLFDLGVLPAGLINLRWASFRNNNLRDITRLASCPRLEELSLENNEIESIDPLSSLTALSKLDASNNSIASIESTSSFRNLMLLSLENNCIKTLKPLAKLTSLMELYVGNNFVADLLSIFPLKELPRLIILDLTGNSACQLVNYRLFTIFHLARLKAYGANITTKEQTSAKDIYLGKLTIELLGEKIGHFTFKSISELDLRSCKIREIDCFANFDFRNLRKLNFDNNLLVSIDCFVGLTGLRTLSLNNNRIERLLSTDLPAPTTLNPGVGSGIDGGGKGFRPLLPYLEELHLGYNAVTRIADLGLYRMPHLKTLYLQGNKICKIDGLEHMTSLVELVLDKNQIKSAEPSSFVSLINLKELHIKENRLRSLSHFDCLPNLQHLYLSNNRVHETLEIEASSQSNAQMAHFTKMKLPSLLEISLVANAVSRKQMYRFALIMRFPQILGIDRKDVTDEERQRAEMYFMEQCMVREEPVGKMSAAPSPALLNAGLNLAKLPIKITSVVLDGKMKVDFS
ncbi:hypothetical protein BDK51DRAFT_18137 [Blyttiomyces helicus]|uniref:Protein phosphatase 1 regulatory subunit 7 n=1 Tax=Blyttiomyces helicus TaxID=388810 RepID=A0A4P9WN00_9FUNG|nr:hypothetical protein BDK51DRAFT_18137 [Blyttiomyces helicus]|eukprot:RKO93872.1 hypothetical protein BDK51DRAFT_18137 [Blyttiomyces helicus]